MTRAGRESLAIFTAENQNARPQKRSRLQRNRRSTGDSQNASRAGCRQPIGGVPRLELSQIRGENKLTAVEQRLYRLGSGQEGTRTRTPSFISGGQKWAQVFCHALNFWLRRSETNFRTATPHIAPQRRSRFGKARGEKLSKSDQKKNQKKAQKMAQRMIQKMAQKLPKNYPKITQNLPRNYPKMSQQNGSKMTPFSSKK